MDDLTRRIIKANPYPDRTLPGNGEEILRRILADADAADRVIRAPSARPSAFGRYLALSSAAVIIVVLTVVAILVFEQRPAGAALPEPLAAHPVAVTVNDLRKEIQMAVSAQHTGRSHPGYRLEGWYHQFEQGVPVKTFIQPQRVETVANPDGSGVTRIYAGTPLSSEQREITQLPVDALIPGTLISETVWEPGSLLGDFPEAPPEQTYGMRAYLREYLAGSEAPVADEYPPDEYTSGDYAFAVSSLMQTWTLSDAAQRAAIDVIIGADGVEIAGSALDRAGREGLLLDLAPGVTHAAGTRDQLVIDTGSWRILAAETLTIDGIPEQGIAPGSVTAYTLWR